MGASGFLVIRVGCLGWILVFCEWIWQCGSDLSLFFPSDVLHLVSAGDVSLSGSHPRRFTPHRRAISPNLSAICRVVCPLDRPDCAHSNLFCRPMTNLNRLSLINPSSPPTSSAIQILQINDPKSTFINRKSGIFLCHLARTSHALSAATCDHHA